MNHLSLNALFNRGEGTKVRRRFGNFAAIPSARSTEGPVTNRDAKCIVNCATDEYGRGVGQTPL
jgi:hypothetical protein